MAILTAVLNWKVAGSIIPSVVSQSMLNNTWKSVTQFFLISVSLTDGMHDSLEEYPEWQHENIKMACEFLDHEDDFIGLPTKYDIHEYDIMERFCLSLKNRQIAEALYNL